MTTKTFKVIFIIAWSFFTFWSGCMVGSYLAHENMDWICTDSTIEIPFPEDEPEPEYQDFEYNYNLQKI